MEIKLLLIFFFKKTEPYEACDLPRAFETSTFEARLKWPGLNLKVLQA